MAAVADLYVERSSWVHRADPRVKFLFVVVAVASVLLFTNVFATALVLLVAHILIFSAQVPFARVRWVWQRMLPINILIFVLILLFYPEGSEFLRLGFFRLTGIAAIRGAALALRLDAIALTVFSWVFTTDQTRMVRGFVKLGLPYEAGLVLALSLRYIPMFYSTFESISSAQQARALELREGRITQRLRNYLPILVAMMISALRTSEKLGRALESRALGAQGVRRTVYRDIRFRRVDHVYLVVLAVLFGAVLALRFGLGIGGELVRF
ncbi:MAG: energy-coupling factor transporter transmembrane protein EcfT [Anaerolineae bacterium]|nr:energy-coupling factor transporter transmembrane protein EcfT [Anaerolineae bacterium]